MTSMRPRLEDLFAASPLYAILDTGCRPELSNSAVMEALLRAGVKIIQYRHKVILRREHWLECCELARRAHEQGALFFVNDRADIARACGADGVHLGQDDLPPDRARRFTGAAMYIGCSTHSLEQAQEAIGLPVDYIAIGPVFETVTKKNPDPVVGLELVRRVRSLTAKPLVAIGGITVENAPSVLAAGANAVAVIGGLLHAPDIEARARELLNRLNPAVR